MAIAAGQKFGGQVGFGGQGVLVGNQGSHQDNHYVDYYAHPIYKFNYAVKDTKTHDIKEQYEERDGDKLKGFYSVVQPDHKVRNVHYEADKNGFRAEVKYEGDSQENGYSGNVLGGAIGGVGSGSGLASGNLGGLGGK